MVIKWMLTCAAFYAQMIYCSGLDDQISRAILIVVVVPATYILALAVIYGIRLGYWDDYLSKIHWSRKLLDCEHDEEVTLLFLIALAVILLGALVPAIFQIGIDLAFITVLVRYMFYRMKYSSWRCMGSIIVYTLLIIVLLYHVYKLFMQL